MTRYELNQARYGEINKGEAVLIFVTSPCSGTAGQLERGDPSKGVTVSSELGQEVLHRIYPTR